MRILSCATQVTTVCQLFSKKCRTCSDPSIINLYTRYTWATGMIETRPWTGEALMLHEAERMAKVLADDKRVYVHCDLRLTISWSQLMENSAALWTGRTRAGTRAIGRCLFCARPLGFLIRCHFPNGGLDIHFEPEVEKAHCAAWSLVLRPV